MPQINDALLDAIAYVESRNNPQAIGQAGERGAYQFLPIAWRDVQQNYPAYEQYGYEQYAHDPEISRAFAQRLLELNQRRLGERGTVENVLGAYNWGIGNVLQGKEIPPIVEAYIQKVLTEAQRTQNAQKP